MFRCCVVMLCRECVNHDSSSYDNIKMHTCMLSKASFEMLRGRWLRS